MASALRPGRDRELVQIVEHALADASERSGSWLACRPGCSQCCHGVFAISMLDVMRLRDGLAELASTHPLTAAAVRERAERAVTSCADKFPGDPHTGILGQTDDDADRFANFANDEPCPALDPSTSTCDLYAARPLTCRVFGPPVLNEDGLGMCELCFVGASESEVSAGEMYLTHGPLEDALNAEAEALEGQDGSTIVAYALLR